MSETADPRTAAANAVGRPPRLTGWLLLAPMLLWLGLFVVAPTAILLVYSFCQRDELGQVVFEFTGDNYLRILDPVYLGILVRSLGYAGLTTAPITSPGRRRRAAHGSCC